MLPITVTFDDIFYLVGRFMLTAN